jgi:hypothetical protein
MMIRAIAQSPLKNVPKANGVIDIGITVTVHLTLCPNIVTTSEGGGALCFRFTHRNEAASRLLTL